jgi:hypothetical protein
MEPERKIEKLLRAFAKKRRAEAGEPFELHPADRRILHGEILKQAPKPRRDILSTVMLALFQPKFGYLYVFAALILVASSLFVVLGPKEPKLERATNKSKEQVLTVASPAPAAAPVVVEGNEAQSRFSQKLEAPAGSVQLATVMSEPPAQKEISNLQNFFRNDASSSSSRATPVLQSFQVQQNGNAISMVDADGSVYSGSMQIAALTKGEISVPGGTLGAPTADSMRAVGESDRVQNEPQAAKNYFFRVTGTNRTLKQNVVFTGNMEMIAGAQTNIVRSLGVAGGHQPAAVPPQQLILSNSRIAGTAVIGSTNQIKINALLATP